MRGSQILNLKMVLLQSNCVSPSLVVPRILLWTAWLNAAHTPSLGSSVRSEDISAGVGTFSEGILCYTPEQTPDFSCKAAEQSGRLGRLARVH